MVNLTKIKRDEMINFLEELKTTHSDDASIRAFNQIENALTEKKFGLVFEEHAEEVDERLLNEIPVLCEDENRKICKDENLPYNFIIEGDNLQALYLLEKTHKGKIDCIYIDPPYNTGARDWKYNNDYVDKNDTFRHSKWLSLIKNRLMAAKTLLNPNNSVLICTIDEKEYLHLGCLLEEIFPESNIQMISSIIAQKGVARTSSFYRVNEFIFIVQIGDSKVLSLNLDKEWQLGKKASAASKGIVWSQLRRSGTSDLRTDSPNLFYPIIFDSEGKQILDVGEKMEDGEHPSSGLELVGDKYYLWPIKSNGDEGRWQLSQKELLSRLKEGYIKVGKKKENTIPVSYLKRGSIKKVKNNEVTVTDRELYNGTIIVDASKYSHEFVPGSQWNIESHDASYHGSQLLKKILPDRKFPFPKSLYATHDTIRFFIADKPNAIVLDFFAGSGTTMHAVNLLNKEDGGNRKCILVTNNEVSEEEEKKLKERGFEPGDEEWENLGIAKYITWPRILCTINGVDTLGKKLKGKYLKSDISMNQGFNANVKYFKCGWTPRKPQDYLLSNVLLLHIKEMIELEHHIEIDNEKYVVILNKNHFNEYILNKENYSKIETAWVNQNIIFTSEELELLNEKEFKYIPKEYFGQELKEAAE